MGYFTAPYFSTYFDLVGSPHPGGPTLPLGPSSYYFCDDYFDATYFEAGPCVTPPPVSTLGRHVRGRMRHVIDMVPDAEPEDQLALILLMTGGR